MVISSKSIISVNRMIYHQKAMHVIHTKYFNIGCFIRNAFWGNIHNAGNVIRVVVIIFFTTTDVSIAFQFFQKFITVEIIRCIIIRSKIVYLVLRAFAGVVGFIWSAWLCSAIQRAPNQAKHTDYCQKKYQYSFHTITLLYQILICYVDIIQQSYYDFVKLGIKKFFIFFKPSWHNYSII